MHAAQVAAQMYGSNYLPRPRSYKADLQSLLLLFEQTAPLTPELVHQLAQKQRPC